MWVVVYFWADAKALGLSLLGLWYHRRCFSDWASLKANRVLQNPHPHVMHWQYYGRRAVHVPRLHALTQILPKSCSSREDFRLQPRTHAISRSLSVTARRKCRSGLPKVLSLPAQREC